MKCLQCGKYAKKELVLEKNGKELPVEFCCYNCYTKFWGGKKQFIPLPEWKD